MPFWNGKYKCLECHIVYNVWIESIDHGASVTLNISSTKKEVHQVPVELKQQFRGKERLDIKTEILAKGTSNVYNENIKFNFLCPDIHKSKSISFMLFLRFH